MIAVVGAGGPTGLECTQKLLRDGKAVRAIVRDVEKYAGKFGQAAVVEGDVTDEESLKDAFAGCSGVVFAASASTYCGSGGPYEVDYLGVENTARAAAAAGVGRVVLVSSRLVNPENRFHPIRAILNNIRYSLMDYKFEGEEALRESGQEYTIVRPGGLVGGEKEPAEKSTPGTEHIEATGPEGDVGSSHSIHRTDVADVVCAALFSPAAKGKTIEITSRARTDEDPSYADHLRNIFKDIPMDE